MTEAASLQSSEEKLSQFQRGDSRPSLAEFTRASLKIGCLGFGGPAGQIALMHKVFVEQKKWLTEQRYMHALNYCMLLPGPEAQQLAVYAGWLLHGVRGGLIGGLLFVLPGAFVVLALSWLYAAAHQAPLMAAAFFGIKAAVFALVLEALMRIGKRALKGRFAISIAIASFLALFLGQAWFPIVVLAAGLFGAATAPRGHAQKTIQEATPDQPSARRSFVQAVIWLAAWLAPLGLSFALLGPDHVLTKIGKVFSILSMVTFGGAYATLAYLQQEAVGAQQWLSASQMIDGLGLAETTPGPLVLVNQFVGFMAGWRSEQGGALLALAGALMASWCTFAPSFAWIFAGAPFAERLSANPIANGVLQGISAAVLGVIANLALWFAMHVMFAKIGTLYLGLGIAVPVIHWASLDSMALGLAVLAAIALFRLKFGVLTLVIASALSGVAAKLAWALWS